MANAYTENLTQHTDKPNGIPGVKNSHFITNLIEDENGNLILEKNNVIEIKEPSRYNKLRLAITEAMEKYFRCSMVFEEVAFPLFNKETIEMVKVYEDQNIELDYLKSLINYDKTKYNNFILSLARISTLHKEHRSKIDCNDVNRILAFDIFVQRITREIIKQINNLIGNFINMNIIDVVYNLEENTIKSLDSVLSENHNVDIRNFYKVVDDYIYNFIKGIDFKSNQNKVGEWTYNAPLYLTIGYSRSRSVIANYKTIVLDKALHKNHPLYITINEIYELSKLPVFYYYVVDKHCYSIHRHIVYVCKDNKFKLIGIN